MSICSRWRIVRVNGMSSYRFSFEKELYIVPICGTEYNRRFYEKAIPA
ncbi:MAG: hypothetical protein WC292_04920 [Clostridia bacterium]